MQSVSVIVVATALLSLWATPAFSQGPTARRGQALFEALARHYPKVHPTVWGIATPTPEVALTLPEGEWAALSREEQVSLTLYVESLIPHVRAHPAQYLGALNEPLSAGERARLATLCARCWLIAVGPLTLDAQGALPGRVVVRGASAGQAEVPRAQAATVAKVCQREAAGRGPGTKAKRSANSPRNTLTISAGAGAKVRSGPGLGCSVLGVAQRGESFTIRGRTRGWYAVDYHGREGWVHRILW